MKLMLNRYAMAAALLLASAAQAHVVLDEPVALAGSSYRAAFRIGHGCSGSPTTGVQVFIPEGVRGAKPMPKAGWQIAIRRAPLARPYQSHGKTVSEDVVEITWTVTDPALAIQEDWYDEFVVRATLPEAASPLWFRVRQICATGEMDWAQIPASGTSTQGLKSPAALLELLPSGATAGHNH